MKLRTLWELWAAGLCDPELAGRWRASVDGWIELIEETIDNCAREHDRSLPLPASSLANLVAIVYHGMETQLLADGSRDLRGHRQLLATIGDAIERFEDT